MPTSPPVSESGQVLLDVRTTKQLGTLMRDWTNVVHDAVLFEVRTLTEKVPSTARGLQEVDDVLAAEAPLGGLPTTARSSGG